MEWPWRFDGTIIAPGERWGGRGLIMMLTGVRRGEGRGKSCEDADGELQQRVSPSL